MYRTAKHVMFTSEPMGHKSVRDLPGIGDVRAGRLESVGISTASQLASLNKRMGRSEFESFLNRTCGQNSLWTGMTIAALDEYNKQNFASVDFTSSQKSNEQKKVMDTRQDMLQMSTTSSSAADKIKRTKELSEEIASLRSTLQKVEENIEQFNKKNISKFKKLKKLPEIVDLLQSRLEHCTRAISTLGDKISSNQQKNMELSADIQSKNGELVELSEKIESVELHLQQRDEYNNGLIEEHTEAIKELSEKTRSIENQLTNKMIDLNKNIESKNDELVNALGKLSNLELRLEKAEKNDKLNKILIVMYCVNTVFLIASTCLFIRQ